MPTLRQLLLTAALTVAATLRLPNPTAAGTSSSWRRARLERCELHPDIEERISKDVSYWGEQGISEEVALSVCHYCNVTALTSGESCNRPQRVLIENGTVYLTNLVAGSFLGPFEHIGFLVELYEASQVYKLPDVEFTYWFGDNAPAHSRVSDWGASEWPYPPAGSMPAIVAWSKWNQNAALVVPYSGAFRCPEDSWDALEVQLESLAGMPWEQRKEVAFGRWNGFCTHYIPWQQTADGQVMKCPRTHLNTLAAAHPDLLDTHDLGQAKPMPLAHQNAYKYIVSTDGWSISSKFDKYLLLGSAVFKAESTRYGFYYDAIKPYQHYIPYMVNSSDDLVDVVRWAKAHDAEVRKVAEEGRRFALHNLNRSARLCYYFRLITELSKKIRYTVTCRRRQLCVPLEREIHFLARYGRTQKSCRYEEVLLRYAGDDQPGADAAGQGEVSYSYDELLSLHVEGDAWPRDDVLAGVQTESTGASS